MSILHAGKDVLVKMASKHPKHPHCEELFSEAKRVLQSSINYIDQLSQQAKNKSVPASDTPTTSGTATPSNGFKRSSDEFR